MGDVDGRLRDDDVDGEIDGCLQRDGEVDGCLQRDGDGRLLLST